MLSTMKPVIKHVQLALTKSSECKLESTRYQQTLVVRTKPYGMTEAKVYRPFAGLELG